MNRAPVVLLTGFDPFGGDAVNPSWEAVSRLHGETLHGHRIEMCIRDRCSASRCG